MGYVVPQSFCLLESRLIISVLSLDVPYDEISPDHACDYKGGGSLARCWDEGIITQADCKSSCSSYEWCVGYNYYLGDFNPGCYLITSTGHCASGAVQNTGSVPASARDLVPGNLGNWTCHGKSGNNK